MKLTVTFKDPDTLIDSLDECQDELKQELLKTLTPAGAKAEAEARMEKMRKLASRVFEYGEYVSIELDDEAGTATVVPVK